jgi:hypothetical protein
VTSVAVSLVRPQGSLADLVRPRNRQARACRYRVAVVRREGGTVFLINGEAYLLRDAAKVLGMKPRTLAKRVERGTPLSKPVQSRARE